MATLHFVPGPAPESNTQLEITNKSPGFISRKIKQGVTEWDRRSLVQGLSKILNMARGHESSGTPSGHEYYQRLYKEADDLVGAYSIKHSIERTKLDAQLPAMLVLHKLAYPAKSGNASKFSTPALAAIVILVPIILGLWTGLFEVGYHWITFHFGG